MDDASKKEFAALIDEIQIPELGKRFLRLRWLDQAAWAEGRANTARKRYYLLRLIAIIGGVVVPALVGLQLQGDAGKTVAGMTFVISLVVAIALAIDSFFRWGERWLHYRRLSELLKSEGWMFFQLGGPYQGTHAAAYPEFVKRVETLITADVDAFVAQMKPDKDKQGGAAQT